ncbi:hypothetical protein N7478_004699 [Penicillium angulare]|uniref:uncharacterized protein n=1 Tax=Penicillium angulare TaxID=116970 RepID=UPI002541EDA7|nr:uncharacterized protein N7478_004699 [Penicillium angulare]KAJ5279327.1 hypothetical protein N7478_004699 [Penicillium angulare]
MPFVETLWKKHGLLSWKTIKNPIALDRSRSQYLISTQLELEFESNNLNGLKEAMQDSETSRIFVDLPNFTNAQPVTQ